MARRRDRRYSTQRLLHAPRSGTPLTLHSNPNLSWKSRSYPNLFKISTVSGREQSPRSPQVLRSDAVGAPNLEAFASQILPTL